MSESDALARFLAADGRDHAGRTYDDVMAFDNERVERTHDFVQWMFPLTEPSLAVPGSPALDARTLETLRASHIARARIERASRKMLGFYRETRGWRRSVDHNHLRITRIIRSLRLIVGDAAAEDFKSQIFSLARGATIDATARRFWTEA